MQLIPKQKQKISEFAKNNPNQEVCGLIVNHEAILCKNISAKPENSFVLCPKSYIECSTIGLITAIFHSHINDLEVSSLIDIDVATKHNLPIITYNLKKDSFHIYLPKPSPYVGRVFELGESDCFTLMRDFYQHELKIGITELSNKYSYSRKSDAFLNYDKLGFRKIDYPEKIGDLIITKDGENNHILIYLGGNTVLHQPMNAFSLIQNYDVILQKKTNIILRHVSR